jgi:spermidine synthase
MGAIRFILAAAKTSCVSRFSIDSLQLSRAEAAVFISGVTSMGLEILAGRMIAPQFGSSIYTWGSIIGVFLAALSYGYWRGGQKARLATNGRMARVFLLTAVYIVLLVYAGDLLLRSLANFPLPSRFASLPAITLLFGPPTYLLGYVSPYAAELSTKSGIGAASGHVYAVGTVGSIIGAFGTTFLLIPEFGIDGIAFIFGLLSLGTALAVGYPDPEFEQRQMVAIGVVTLLLIAAVAGPAIGVTLEGRTVYETQTPYQELRVSDLGDTRTLYLDGQRHSAMDLNEPLRHVFDYTRYFHLPLLLAQESDDIKRILFIGGGGFTGPKRFIDEYPAATVDVVEIDPEVIRVAKEYFAVSESDRLTIHRAGGREFLRETGAEYDLIVLDAYRKDKVPFEMTTLEFMKLASQRLAEDGMLVANLVSAPTGGGSEFYRAEYKTLAQVFPQVYTFQTAQASVVQNVEVVASKRSVRTDKETLLARNRARHIGIDLEAEIRYYRDPPQTTDVPILRDDYAPVERLLDPMVGQRYVMSKSNETIAPTDGRPGI